MKTTRYEVHWEGSKNTRVLDTPDREVAKRMFQDSLNEGWPCKLVRVERSDKIEAAWNWKET